MPSWPLPLAPQHHSVPPARMPQVCEPPGAIWVQSGPGFVPLAGVPGAASAGAAAMAAATPAATITAARAMIRAATGLIFGTGQVPVFPFFPRIIANFPYVAGKNYTRLP